MSMLKSLTLLWIIAYSLAIVGFIQWPKSSHLFPIYFSFLMKEKFSLSINLTSTCCQPKFPPVGIIYHSWEITMVNLSVLEIEYLKVQILWGFFLKSLRSTLLLLLPLLISIWPLLTHVDPIDLLILRWYLLTLRNLIKLVITLIHLLWKIFLSGSPVSTSWCWSETPSQYGIWAGSFSHTGYPSTCSTWFPWWWAFLVIQLGGNGSIHW